MSAHNLQRLSGVSGTLLLMLMLGSTVVVALTPDVESDGDPGRQRNTSAELSAMVSLPVVVREWTTPRAPNDPYYVAGTQWNLDQISGPLAWAQTTGSASVIIAIVDTGVDADHPDLAGKTVAGYDFVHDDANPADDHGHGTHCAGVAAAVTDNGVGIAGVSWDARIMPVKVLDHQGTGYDSWIADGIRWAADHGARVISLSLAGEETSNTLKQAVNYAHGKGCLVVAAVGNCGDPTDYDCSTWNPNMYPAAYPNVLGVGATGDQDERAAYSEFNSSVDVTAPGGNPTSSWDTNPRHWILSTYWPGHGYESAAGTSQAAPHVAGLAALVWSVNPGLSPDQVQSAIQSGADDLGSPGRDDQFGYGRINAARTLSLAATAIQSASGTTSATSRPIATGPVAAKEFAPGVVLVKFKPGVSVAAQQTALDDHRLTVLAEIPGLHVLRVRVPTGQEFATAQWLDDDARVEYAELDTVYRTQ